MSWPDSWRFEKEFFSGFAGHERCVGEADGDIWARCFECERDGGGCDTGREGGCRCAARYGDGYEREAVRLMGNNKLGHAAGLMIPAASFCSFTCFRQPSVKLPHQCLVILLSVRLDDAQDIFTDWRKTVV